MTFPRTFSFMVCHGDPDKKIGFSFDIFDIDDKQFNKYLTIIYPWRGTYF